MFSVLGFRRDLLVQRPFVPQHVHMKDSATFLPGMPRRVWNLAQPFAP